MQVTEESLFQTDLTVSKLNYTKPKGENITDTWRNIGNASKQFYLYRNNNNLIFWTHKNQILRSVYFHAFLIVSWFLLLWKYLKKKTVNQNQKIFKKSKKKLTNLHYCFYIKTSTPSCFYSCDLKQISLARIY